MIDIIIPAYNAFETIGKTIGSIAKQINRNDLIVYIVNDGSTKSYDYIIEQYKSLLKIKEIIIENSGPGEARQKGVDASKNEFIVFMDADDELYKEDSILTLLNIIHNADLAQGAFLEKSNENEKVFDAQYCYLHGKMYRRSVIKNNKIKFDKKRRYDGDIYEDSSFNQIYSLCCKNIATTNELVYIYNYNPKSITKTYTDETKNLYNYVDAMTWLAKEINKREITNLHDLAWNCCIICFHMYHKYLITENQSQFIFENASEIKKIYKKYIDNLPYEEQVNIYKFFDYPIVPKISFYDFMDKIKD